jgi:hypothetical protein
VNPAAFLDEFGRLQAHLPKGDSEHHADEFMPELGR